VSGLAKVEGRGVSLAVRRPVVLAALDDALDHASSLAWATAEAAAQHAVLRTVSLSPGVTPWPPLADLLIVGTDDDASAMDVLSSLPRSGRRRLASPAIVLRHARLQPIRRIVVGVPRSRVGEAAVRWAVDEAAVHRAGLVLVHAWQRQTGVGRSMWRDSLDRADAQRIVDHAVGVSTALSCGDVRGEVHEGEPGAVLVRASMDADLLVVGTRAQSGFTAMLFGPVTTFLIGAAGCPVALIDLQGGHGMNADRKTSSC
jgi:nucleotide-binding universal stress UspA family protein